jgi:type IV pilus assembly protein PilC
MGEKEKKVKKKSSGFYLRGVSSLTVALSIRHLSLMLKSGLSLADAVKVLSEKTTDKRLKATYSEIYQSIQEGMNLSDSMKNHKNVFSDIVISIISVGEQGGTLEKNLLFIAEYLKKSNDLNRKVKGALIYPAIVLGLTVVEMLGVIFFILPKLEELFLTFDNIPEFTLFVINAAGFIRNNALSIALVIIVIIVAVMLFLKTEVGALFKDKTSIKFPVIKKLNKSNILATFSRTLNILLETGIPLVRAIEITSTNTGNRVYREIISEVYEKVKGGKSLGESLSEYEEFFPATYTKMIEIGENTGSLEQNLFYMYEYNAEEVEEMSSNLTNLLEPILLIFIGAMIGFLAIIIIGPIYQFTGSITS